MILQTLVAVILCAILYRLGGMGGAWWKNTKVRDLGVPIVCTTWMVLNYTCPWWVHVLPFVLLFATLTTYWDKIFDYDNYYAHGLICGLAYISYGNIGFVVVRAILMGILMGTLCDNTENDWIEELGRGAVIALTLPLLLL